MSTRTIVNCFALVVALLIGLGVWGWYASDDSRAEVLRLRDERRLEVFCQQYRGVESIENFYAPVFIPESTTSSIPIDPNLSTTSSIPFDPNLSTTSSIPIDPNAPPTGSDPFDPGLPPPSSDYPFEPIVMVDLDRLEQNAPSAVEEEIGIVVDADEKVRRTGDTRGFVEPEVQRAIQRITAYGNRRCP
jgi:hypothetical protein